MVTKAKVKTKGKKVAAKKAPVKAKAMSGSSSAEAAHKLQVFKQAYLSNGGSKTQAAKTAGYSEKTAGQAGYRLFKAIEKEIQEAQTAIAEKMGLSLERTLREVARLAYADPRKLYNADGTPKSIHDLDDDTAAIIAGVEVEVDTESVADYSKEGDKKAEKEGERPMKIATTRTVKIKIHDKKGALDMAMKFHGAYERDNNQKQTVVLNLTSEDEAL